MSGDEMVLPAKFNIEDLIKQAKAQAAEDGEAASATAEEEAGEPEGMPSLDRLMPLPRPGDPYKAYARPANAPLPTLCLLKSDGTVWSYPYSCRVEGPHLVPAKDSAKNLVLVLRFSGIVATEITLAGRKLEQLTLYLGHHRVGWVREMAKGKLGQDDGGPVITGIAIKELER